MEDGISLCPLQSQKKPASEGHRIDEEEEELNKIVTHKEKHWISLQRGHDMLISFCEVVWCYVVMRNTLLLQQPVLVKGWGEFE